MKHRASSLLGLLLSACTPSMSMDAGTQDSGLFDVLPEASVRPFCTATPPTYPPGPYELSAGTTIPDLSFARADGSSFALHDVFTPCASSPKLIVLRVMAAWSGPSRWHAEHTQTWRGTLGARMQITDLLVLGQDNLPARREDVSAWLARYDSPPDAIVLDPGYQLRPLLLASKQLPLMVLIDPRTMKIVRVMEAPAVHRLRDALARAVAELDGAPIPAPTPVVLHDNRFSDDQWDLIRAMGTVPTAPPPDPTNAFANDARAAQLGERLFQDTAFSSTGRVACASCHDPTKEFADGRPVGVGVAAGGRNTPSIRAAVHMRWQFWDGRADSLWSQALGPMENPVEMNTTRLQVAHRIADQYATEYTSIFGPLPSLQDTQRFPLSGKPGEPAWDGMNTTDQTAINRVFVNVGKAIAAFERTLTLSTTPFDAYAAGNVDAMSVLARDGLKTFFDNGCIQCHHGPLLSDQSFHNIVMPTGLPDGRPDDGRWLAIPTLMASRFTVSSPFSDAPMQPSLPADAMQVEAMRGQFRTPSLRDVMWTGPWGHGGTFAIMGDLIVHYAQRGRGTPVPGTSGVEDQHLSGFHEDSATVRPIVELMRAFSHAP